MTYARKVANELWSDPSSDQLTKDDLTRFAEQVIERCAKEAETAPNLGRPTAEVPSYIAARIRGLATEPPHERKPLAPDPVPEPISNRDGL